MKKRFLTEAIHNFLRNLIRHPKYRWWVIVAGLFYVLSPLDISPDVFPIVGWIDDGAIATLLVAEVAQVLIDQSKTRKAQEKASTTQAATTATTATTIDVEAVAS
ncbi:MAG TPA: YkvA family protein [Allocoleopsis sp.]